MVRILREVVLWIAAALGVLCLLVAAAAVLLHVTPLVFRSGSMTPAIPTGSIALARTEAPSAVRTGQIVSVVLPDGTRVTHRVVHVRMEGALARIRLKGDANAHPDPEPVVTSSIEHVFWSVPEVGFLLTDLNHAPVVFVGGALVGMVAMWGFRRPESRLAESGQENAALLEEDGLGLRDDDAAWSVADPRITTGSRHTHGARHGLPRRWGRAGRDGDGRRDGHGPAPGRGLGRGLGRGRRGDSGPGHGTALSLGIAVLVLGTTGFLGASPAHAVGTWTDAATATTPTLKAGSLTAPVSFTCSPSSGITLTWVAPASPSVRPDSYTIAVANSGLGTPLTSVGPITGTSYSFPASLLTIGNKYTFTLTAWAGGWSSTFASTRSATVLAGLVVICNNS